MCGIIGVIGHSKVSSLLIEGLKRLEYRGYDSAGIATLLNGKIDRRRSLGKIENLKKLLKKSPIKGNVGIGHTRWATHGIPSRTNAHPHSSGDVAVVHNGIIENYDVLRKNLERKNIIFESDTDTEVIAHLISFFLKKNLSPLKATITALKKVEGAFALGIIFSGIHNYLICAKRGSPLAIGKGKNCNYIGSDSIALAPLTQKLCYLNEGDIAEITSKDFKVYDQNGKRVKRKITITSLAKNKIKMGGYNHFMQKEIFEQPAVIGDALKYFIDTKKKKLLIPSFAKKIKKIKEIYIAACGTSYHASLIGKYWLEKYANIKTEVDIASEFRYRNIINIKNSLGVFLSQSGETADTLAVLRYFNQQKGKTLGIINSAESSIARESNNVIETHAGPEIGVASTKAFTTQLVALGTLTLFMANFNKTIGRNEINKLSNALLEAPGLISKILKMDNIFHKTAISIKNAKNVLYIGRGTNYPVALEGALKLKEISYIHAEGYPAGEIKHGPIALVEKGVPVIVIAPSDQLIDKTISNVEELLSRGAKIIFISDKKGIKKINNKKITTICLPETHEIISPILYSVPVQLIAYHTAVLKGTDVDQPRNLAKSVTVE
jgi:glucosamine--fructose-6-phosphate aminotransferase (isomerizing)